MRQLFAWQFICVGLGKVMGLRGTGERCQRLRHFHVLRRRSLEKNQLCSDSDIWLHAEKGEMRATFASTVYATPAHERLRHGYMATSHWKPHSYNKGFRLYFHFHFPWNQTYFQFYCMHLHVPFWKMHVNGTLWGPHPIVFRYIWNLRENRYSDTKFLT